MKHRLCTCKQCKAAKRKGLILHVRPVPAGPRWGAHFISAYVPFAKWAKGWRIRRPKNKEKDLEL